MIVIVVPSSLLSLRKSCSKFTLAEKSGIEPGKNEVSVSIMIAGRHLLTRTCETTTRQIDFSLVLDVRELGDKHALDRHLVHVKIVSLEIEVLQRE